MSVGRNDPCREPLDHFAESLLPFARQGPQIVIGVSLGVAFLGPGMANDVK